MVRVFDVLILGGGAAGYFTAINIAEKAPKLKIAILERGKEVLTKVKVSGGGRCNVTHAQFDPRELTGNYPRGEKELLGPFHTFMTGDTIAWFEARGIELKIEEDGRMFPVTDSSQTIIDCFTSEVDRLGVLVFKGHAVKSINKDEAVWNVNTSEGNFQAEKLVVATGSNPKVWKMLVSLGHTIERPVPSLFTFNINDPRINDLPGISTMTQVQIINKEERVILESSGPLLITHWGMSGPAILKLSAWGARILEPLDYNFLIKVNWLYDIREVDAIDLLKVFRKEFSKQKVHKNPKFDLPKRLWFNLVLATGLDKELIWADLTNIQIEKLAKELSSSFYKVTGKSTFKEEFVTAGGVALNEINFKTFGSKLYENLYFAGEVLNIDAITGGFNFQNAWTGGYMVAQAITASS